MSTLSMLYFVTESHSLGPIKCDSCLLDSFVRVWGPMSQQHSHKLLFLSSSYLSLPLLPLSLSLPFT